MTARAVAAPPPNDDFAQRVVLSDSLPLSVTASNLGATREDGEPSHSDSWPGERTLWWEWTAPADGDYLFQAEGTNITTVLAVYEGDTLGTLQRLATDTYFGNGPAFSQVRLSLAAGKTVHVVVSGFNFSPSEELRLRLQTAQPPVNDVFVNATEITGPLPRTFTLVNADLASAEDGEPPDANGSPVAGLATLWWRWVAPRSGRYHFLSTVGNTTLTSAVYTGESPANLTRVDQFGYYRVEWEAAAGTVYVLRSIAQPYSARPTLAATLGPVVPPPNDAWADAVVMAPTLPSSSPGSLVDAGTEVGEPPVVPDESDPQRTIWWKWTSPATGPVRISPEELEPSWISVNFQVFSGASLESLRRLDHGTGRFNHFNAAAGETYFIRASYFVSTSLSPEFRLQLSSGFDPPANDAFANATALDGVPSAVVTLEARGATQETGESGTSEGFYNLDTVWYRWTAPSSARVTLRLGDVNGVQWTARVYTGSALNSLTAIPSPFLFTPIEGQTYHFQIAMASPAPDGAANTIQLVAVPPNDEFANATELPPDSPPEFTVSTYGAYASFDEPNTTWSLDASVWYRWTPSWSGEAVLTLDAPAVTVPSTFGLTVFTGSSMPTLQYVTGVSRGQPRRWQFTAGVPYMLRVGSSWTRPNVVRVSLVPIATADEVAAAALDVGAGLESWVGPSLDGGAPNYLHIRFPRQRGQSALAYTVLVGESPSRWDASGQQVQQVGEAVMDPDTQREWVTSRLQQPVEADATRYIKLRVTAH